jgi:hypothetical protein
MKTHSTFAAVLNKSTVLAFVAAVYAGTFAAEPADDRVKIDNEQARVLVVTSAPGVKSELHEHKMNRVMIYLDAGKMTLTDTAGKVETLNFKAGEVLWSQSTMRPHVSLNVSDHPEHDEAKRAGLGEGGPEALQGGNRERPGSRRSGAIRAAREGRDARTPSQSPGDLPYRVQNEGDHAGGRIQNGDKGGRRCSLGRAFEAH